MAFLFPFDEGIYLPALSAMIGDFHTTQTLGLLSVSLYLFGLSFSGIIWGVLADFYGRKPIATLAMAGFLLSIVVAYFSTNIYVFLVLRMLQGCFISAPSVIGQAILADVYSADTRGSAIGIFYGVYFGGMVLAPVLGGQISYCCTWRSTMILVGMISLISLIGYVTLVPETHRYKVAKRYEADSHAVLIETNEIPKPTLTNPFVVVLYLLDLTILPYVFVLVVGYVSLNIGLLLFSTQLADEPYSYGSNTIGLLYIPFSMAMLIGSIIGGRLTDHAAVNWFQTSKIIEGRMVPGMIFAAVTPIGLIIYGWCEQFGAHVFTLVLGQIIYGTCQSATRPSVYSYFTIKYQDHSAAIISANNFAQLLLTSVVLSSATTMTQLIGSGWFFTFLAIANLLATSVAALTIYGKVRVARNSEQDPLLSVSH